MSSLLRHIAEILFNLRRIKEITSRIEIAPGLQHVNAPLYDVELYIYQFTFAYARIFYDVRFPFLIGFI